MCQAQCRPVGGSRVHHVEFWFLAAQSHLPCLPHEPAHEADAEADAQSAENHRDDDLPSLPSVIHRMLSILLSFLGDWWISIIYFTGYRWRNLYRARHRACSFDGKEANKLFWTFFVDAPCSSSNNATSKHLYILLMIFQAHTRTSIRWLPSARQRETSQSLISSSHRNALPSVHVRAISTDLGLVKGMNVPFVLSLSAEFDVFRRTLMSRRNDFLCLSKNAEFDVIVCTLTNRR